MIREAITAKYPAHAIIGEEFGVSGDPATAEICWVLDPIDGTRDFVVGVHTWGTLIAALKGGVPVVGLIDQPATKDLRDPLQARCAFASAAPGRHQLGRWPPLVAE